MLQETPVVDGMGGQAYSVHLTCLSVQLSLQVLEMMTTWGGGVEAAVVAPVTEGVEEAEQEEEWVASEKDPGEDRQTSGNRLKVTAPPLCGSELKLCYYLVT